MRLVAGVSLLTNLPIQIIFTVSIQTRVPVVVIVMTTMLALMTVNSVEAFESIYVAQIHTVRIASMHSV